MDSPVETSRNSPASEATRDIQSLDVMPSDIRRGPRAELVEDTGPELSAETRALLRSRLRAAALMLFMGFGVFLVWSFFGSNHAGERNWFLLGFHVAVVVILGVFSAPLCKDCTYSLRRLRTYELVIFGMPAAFFLAMQHWGMLCCAEEGYFQSAEGTWLALIFTYAIFIPNTWRRAAVVVGAMAVAPVLLTLIMLTHGAFAQVVTADDLSSLTLMMLIGAVTGTYGTHTIGSLRRQAFEAKQFGQYRLRRLLGAGGMGEVHLAEHRLLKRPCAIKLIRPGEAADPKALARFEREVRATAKLTHWNSVEIFDYGHTDDGTFYYVMEYLPGLDLGELVTRFGPMPADRAVHLLRQTCDALREAHAMGLIHRDIKPGNIIAAKRGGVHDIAKLLDFGLVKPIAEPSSVRLTQDGSITGSPLYMSPEQATGESEPDARSDVYSLGAVAYYLLTGRAPFESNHPMQVILAHARDDVVPPSRLRADVPADLEHVVLRCLAKRPEDRFANVDALQSALVACAVADGWTPERAAEWWQEAGPLGTASDESSEGPESRECVSVVDPSLTGTQ